MDVENTKQDIAIADKASKSYVDKEIAKIPKQPQNVLLLDGSKAMTGDLNMGSQNIFNVKYLTDYKVDNPIDYRIKDLKSAVNKEYLNAKFLKKDANDNDFDLQQKVIRNCEPYYDGLFGRNDLVSKAYVDTKVGKLPKPDTDVLKLDGSKAMTGNLNMGDNPIIGIRSSSQNNAALTVGGAKATYLTLGGQRSMQGNLNMGGFAIKNIKPFVEDDSSQAASDAQKNYGITFGYFKDERAQFLRKDGSEPMSGNLKMNNNSIVNLKDPKASDNTHAATVNFVNKTINDSNTIISILIDTKIKKSEERSVKAV